MNESFTYDEIRTLITHLIRQTLFFDHQIEVLRNLVRSPISDRLRLMIALSCNDYDLADEAVDHIADPEVLLEAALLPYSPFFHYTLRRHAVQKLTDQAKLAEVAFRSEYPTVRIAALERLTDPQYLVPFLLNVKPASFEEAEEEEVTDPPSGYEFWDPTENEIVSYAWFDLFPDLETAKWFSDEYESDEDASWWYWDDGTSNYVHFMSTVEQKVSGVSSREILERIAAEARSEHIRSLARERLTQIDGNSGGQFAGEGLEQPKT